MLHDIAVEPMELAVRLGVFRGAYSAWIVVTVGGYTTSHISNDLTIENGGDHSNQRRGWEAETKVECGVELHRLLQQFCLWRLSIASTPISLSVPE